MLSVQAKSRRCLGNENMSRFIVTVIFTLYIALSKKCIAQTNRPPEFLRGGDMAKFTIKEDTVIGSSVYTLRARDPENTKISYYISGDVLTAERDTGVVRLVRPLDRETDSTVVVIISITDERFFGLEPNTISVKREITVLDVNDNPPKFQNLPYRSVIEETAIPGSKVFDGIFVTDSDIGINSEIKLSCAKHLTPVACETFEVQSFTHSDGRLYGELILKEKLDFEKKSSYVLTLIAEDLTPSNSLSSSVNITIDIKDIQDQPPVFQNAPYTATIPENSPEGVSVLTILVKDGDSGDPRNLTLVTENDDMNFFKINIKSVNERNLLTAVIETANPMDREDDKILSNGGLYVFQLKAIELIDGKAVGDSSLSNVTVVIGDVNDRVPIFNEKEFHTTVPENIGTNTPLPGLNIVVSDMDVGENARFTLQLEDIQNSDGVFTVFPTSAVGRTPIVIRAVDSTKLDFENPEKRTFKFYVKAVQGDFSSSTVVTVDLSDANDNSPVFENDKYVFQVPENAPPSTSIFTLKASDADSGINGQVKYSLKGFGSDKLKVNSETGEISVADCGKPTCLDYEMQKSYSLTYEAQDGGGKLTSVNLFIEVIDENDNAPQFPKEIYSREIQENMAKLLPPLFIKASDADGPSQGGGKMSYRIASIDLSSTDVFTINENTGELTIKRPIKFSEVPNSSGLVTITVEAIDGGNPPLSSTVNVIVKVKKENAGAPEFLNQPYKTIVPENAPGGTSIFKVSASDPDGPDSSLSYFIDSGAKDNFVIDEKSGTLSVSKFADLDRELSGTEYKIVVQAVDAGIPVKQTATATVLVSIEDVNNKPPVFEQESYVAYISESLGIGEEVLQVAANDLDHDARIRYSIVEPIYATDKSGADAKSSTFNIKEAFKIDSVSGRITVNRLLDYNSAIAIIFTIEALDLNAVDAALGKQQRGLAEVTVYIRAEGEMNPVFSPPWTQAKPVIEITVPEEAIIGSTLLTVSARDPLNHQSVTLYEKISGSDPDNYVSVSPVTGVVSLNRRLDFEELSPKYIKFKVKAIIGDVQSQRSSEATVILNVQDINDNSPVFSKDSYMISISEYTSYPDTIITVAATDSDRQEEFGIVRFSVSGDGSDVFDIDPVMGNIFVRENVTLDREKKAVYYLQVSAKDNPNSTTNQRRTSVIVVLKILDENDNPPMFNEQIYSSVIPENVPIKFSVVTVKAKDIDSEKNGDVSYTFVNDGDVKLLNFFAIDSKKGIVSVVSSLSGKGRSEPYKILIRATDSGSPPLHSDCHLLVVIADISTNDGMPQFIRPVAGEVAYIHENATVGTEVFQVVAYDPDNPNTANGKVAYKLIEDLGSQGDRSDFVIDAASGIISTNAPLDRETKENYTMIIVAHDFGFPPQESQQVLHIVLLDVDDSDPQFSRPLRTVPIEMVLKEEIPVGTIVGRVQAVDNDTGVNSVIGYYIVGGNEDGYFGIRRTTDNVGEIIVQKRIDHENVTDFVLTIKVSKPSKPLDDLVKEYNYQDLSEIQVSVRIEDIDDNSPTFETLSYVLGAKVDTEVETELVVLRASDPDSSSGLVTYSIKNTTFIRPMTEELEYVSDVFHINDKTGELRNLQHLGKYAAGYFDILVEARSAPGVQNVAFANVKIYILQDKDLLKFVFYKRPAEVKNLVPQFQKDLRSAVSQPVSVNLYDTQFYTRKDGSLDFESTSSCFQLLENNVLLEPKNVLNLLDQKKSSTITQLFQNYSIASVESCAAPRDVYKMKWTEVMVLVIAGFIAVAAFIMCIVLCVMYSKYNEKLKQTSYFHTVYVSNAGGRPSGLSAAEQQRIYEWQEMNAPLADAASFRSYPTLR